MVKRWAVHLLPLKHFPWHWCNLTKKSSMGWSAGTCTLSSHHFSSLGISFTKNFALKKYLLLRNDAFFACILWTWHEYWLNTVPGHPWVCPSCKYIFFFFKSPFKNKILLKVTSYCPQQGHVGWCFEQPSLVGGVPGRGLELGDI